LNGGDLRRVRGKVEWVVHCISAMRSTSTVSTLIFPEDGRAG
jgi:hypothetical protein